MSKIYLSRFEYDYLVSQVEVDTQKLHMDQMIRKGYFHDLSPFFVHEDCKSRPDGKLHYVLIGTIRDHLKDFVISDAVQPKPEDFTPSSYITTCSDKEIVKNCISLLHGLTGEFSEYLEYIDADTEEPFRCRYNYMEIVGRLLLWGTGHSGGTSTVKKCNELGFDYGDEVVFSTQED